MIKDCVEDLMFILRSTAKKASRSETPDKVGSMGYPTVDEIMRLSDVYYGPPKLPMHGSI